MGILRGGPDRSGPGVRGTPTARERPARAWWGAPPATPTATGVVLSRRPGPRYLDVLPMDAPAYRPTHPVRFVTAAALFDGHDAAINVIRRLLQDSGAEVVHLGHNRSVLEIVQTAVDEDAQGIAISSYQGGHVEFFKYAKDLLEELGAGHVKLFGGGGGVIVPAEIEELERVRHREDLQPRGRPPTRAARDDRRHDAGGRLRDAAARARRRRSAAPAVADRPAAPRVGDHDLGARRLRRHRARPRGPCRRRRAAARPPRGRRGGHGHGRRGEVVAVRRARAALPRGHRARDGGRAVGRPLAAQARAARCSATASA